MIQALIALVNDPEPEHPLRTDLAEEYIKDRKKFFKNAEDYTKKFAEKRPSDWSFSPDDIEHASFETILSFLFFGIIYDYISFSFFGDGHFYNNLNII